MKISTRVQIQGKPKSGGYMSDETAVLHEASSEITELGDATLDTLTPEHVEQMRDRVGMALKNAGKQLSAELDTLAEFAETRAADARKKARDEAKETVHAL